MGSGFTTFGDHPGSGPLGHQVGNLRTGSVSPLRFVLFAPPEEVELLEADLEGSLGHEGMEDVSSPPPLSIGRVTSALVAVGPIPDFEPCLRGDDLVTGDKLMDHQLSSCNANVCCRREARERGKEG